MSQSLSALLLAVLLAATFGLNAQGAIELDSTVGEAPHATGTLELVERPAVRIDDTATALASTGSIQAAGPQQRRSRTSPESSQSGLGTVGGGGGGTFASPPLLLIGSEPSADDGFGEAVGDGEGGTADGVGAGGGVGGDPAALPNPEPSTIVIWFVLAVCGAWVVRRGKRK